MILNGFLEKIILPTGDQILGTVFMKSLEEWRSIQMLSEAELDSLQKYKLHALLTHAVSNIPFYKSLDKQKKIYINDFPIITKEVISLNLDYMLWHPTKKDQLVCEKSSGSSGVQGMVYMSKKEQSKIMALQTLMWEWAGYKIGKEILQTGMTRKRSTVKKLKDILLKVDYQVAFGLSEKEIHSILFKHINKKPIFFGGYASSLYLFAQTALQKDVKNVKFESVISWGDKMFDHYRSAIESCFDCKVYDIYGSTEGFVISGQKDLEYQYIFTPHVYLEILDKDGNEVKDGEIGYVVLTSLDAFEMPLIRYNLGDLAIKLPRHKYPKDRSLQLPLLQKIVGRETDIVYTPKGKGLIVHTFTGIMEHYQEIKQFRVIQTTLNKITIEYIPRTNFNPTVISQIKSRIHKEVNEAFNIEFIEVVNIPNSPSGKPQIIVSSLKRFK